MLRVPLNVGKSAAYCQGNVRQFFSVWRLVTLYIVFAELPRKIRKLFQLVVHSPGNVPILFVIIRFYLKTTSAGSAAAWLCILVIRISDAKQLLAALVKLVGGVAQWLGRRSVAGRLSLIYG